MIRGRSRALTTANHLALREIWRNRGRFLLFSLVIALITVLILFIAALGEGLGAGNREYIEKLNAELVVYQDIARLSVASSRLDRVTYQFIRSIEGVRDAGPISFAAVAIPMGGEADDLDVALIGVTPGRPGEPRIVAGNGLQQRSADQAIIDRTVALMTGLRVGDTFTIRSAQGVEDEFYDLSVVGVSDSQKYGLRPSVIVPCLTWDKVRPQAIVGTEAELLCNLVAVQLDDPMEVEAMRQALMTKVSDVDIVDLKTAYESTPGYTEQQTTLNTQNSFALLIGGLVIGGFFQIQTLQKVPQIGMLKAIGARNSTIALATMVQIVLITLLGVLIGGLATFGLSLSFPPGIPIVFSGGSTATALASILLIGPLGGLVSIRYSLRVEPLIALGLNS
jgi:putative ABC transport system permease protein